MIKNNKDKPLVSVIIPTYCRPVWFELALQSVLNQTYDNIEIFITDNSPDTRTRDLMQKYLEKYSNIIYEYHPEYKEMDNWQRALSYNNPEAEYVNWLMDDDLFMPNKIEYMMDKFMRFKNLALVTSYRQCIDSDGNIMQDYPSTRALSDKDVIYSGKGAGKAILTNMTNFIGEPSTVLIKKSCMKDGTLGSRTLEKQYFVSDFTTWLCCMEKGALYYVAKPLSQFRVHGGQEQHRHNHRGGGLIRWGMEFCYEFNKLFYLDNPNECAEALARWLSEFEDFVKKCIEDDFKDDVIFEDLINMAETLIQYRKNMI